MLPMKKRDKSYSGRVLFFLMFFSVVIATVEGILFYSGEKNLFFRILLILENDITLFGFGAKISLTDAFSLLKEQTFPGSDLLCYAYAVAIFVAPYCTVLVLYRVLEYLFSFVFLFRRGKGKDPVVIFGYNDAVEAMLGKGEIQKTHVRVHIISSEEFSTEQRYTLRRRGCEPHTFDCLNATEKDLTSFAKKVPFEKTKTILLFEKDAVKNFSLLQLFALDRQSAGKRGIVLPEAAKVFCCCENEDVNGLIGKYYNDCTSEKKGYDLEVFSLAELQVREMYERYPLFTYYEDRQENLADRELRVLIAGFGTVGQQALLQAMNLGAVHSKNPIRIDVVDECMEERIATFTNRFSKQVYRMEGNCLRIKPEVAEGSLEIYFHNINVKHRSFHELVRAQTEDSFYHYAVVSIKDTGAALHCVMELKQELDLLKKCNVPVVLQMEQDKRLAEYIAVNVSQFAGVSVLPSGSKTLSLEMLIDRALDEKAKKHHLLYSTLRILEKTERREEVKKLSEEEAWKRLGLFRREANRATAAYRKTAEQVAERLAQENGVVLKSYLEKIFGTNGTLFCYDGTLWRQESTEAFLTAIRKDKLAYEFMATEHRRWCYFMISKGWKCGEQNDDLRTNPCVVTLTKLEENEPDKCKYDLMPLLALYLNQKDKGNA